MQVTSKDIAAHIYRYRLYCRIARQSPTLPGIVIYIREKKKAAQERQFQTRH